LFEIDDLDIEPTEERLNYFFFHKKKHQHFIEKYQKTRIIES
jgi:hypothetical protein